MRKKRTTSKEESLIAVFFENKEASHNAYVTRYKAALKKARESEREYAGNRLLSTIRDEINGRWKDISNMHGQCFDAMRLDKQVTFENWIESQIITRKPTKEAVKEWGEYFGYEFFISWAYGQEPFKFESDDNPKIKSPFQFKIKWADSKKFSERDFIKIAYSLHYSGILRTEDDGVYKFVEELSRRLEFPLSKNWQKNLYGGLGYSNGKFNPLKVFDLLRSSFENYLSERTNKDK